MEKLSKNIDTLIDRIKEMAGNSSDINVRKLKIGKKKIAYLFLESTTSGDTISDFIVKSLSQDVKQKNIGMFEDLFKTLENTIPNSKLKTIDNYEDMFYYLSSGFTCVLVPDNDKAMVLETRAKLDRGVTEATTEPIIRGPKDSFTENHNMNLGLIRKRIKDPNLWFYDVIVGKRTKTKVSIAYIQDIIDTSQVEQIKKKLEEIDIDGVLDSGYIREFLEPHQKSTFPKMLSTERPDLVCQSLLEGKIVVLVENTPYVLIMPSTILDFFHSPEDNYQKPANVTFTRALRFLSFFLTIVTPSLYIALTTFNHEVIPDNLLISLAVQREGVPFPTAVEILLLGITFEMLREADMRSPTNAGTAMSIVGALILGDAAVSAGIVSPIVIIVIATTSICELVFSDIDMISAIRGWRLVFLGASMVMGLMGFVIACILCTVKLVSLESLGVPYTAPISPFHPKDWLTSIVRSPKTKQKLRPTYLNNKDMTKMGGDPN